jgi:hypothetical protein
MLRSASPALGVLLIASLSCLEPAEPTPVSPDVRIEASFGTVNGFESDQVSSFAAQLTIVSTSSRPIFVDGSRIFFEKLVDQKWKYAAPDDRRTFNSIFVLEGGAARGVEASVLYVRSTGNELSILDHIRGVYRAHFRLGFDRTFDEKLDSASTYSQPFTVQ